MAAYGSLSFAEQIAFFRQKVNLGTQRWDDILGAAHDRSFVVAGAAKADLLADLRAAVTKAIAQGTTLAEFRKDFEALVARHGWTGWTGEGTAAGRAWRTRIIYETNLRASYAAGRWAQIQQVKAERPYLLYRHNDNVLHPRPLHVAWDGKVIAADDPWWRTHFPPNGWGCQCRVHAVDDAYLRKLGKAGPDPAPDDGTYDYFNKVSGITLRDIPKGIDPGWDYAPGQNRYELDQMLLDPKLNRLFGRVKPAAIAHGAKFDRVALVLQDFLGDFGEAVPQFVNLIEEQIANYKMATRGNGIYFLPAATSHAAIYAKRINDSLAKNRQGARLAWEEESMIKTLWHEIGHNRQTGLTTRAYATGSVNEYLLEATNEYVALRTYPQFLRAIGGGEARWKGSVRTDSGYLDRVNNLEALLEAVGVYPNDFLAEMERVTFAGPIDDGHGNTLQGNLAEAIAKAGRAAGWKGLSKTKVNAALKHIQRQDKFNQALDALRASRAAP